MITKDGERKEGNKKCAGMCEVAGCDLESRMVIYGHDFCWSHYTKWIEAWRVDAFGINPDPIQKELDFGDIQAYNMREGKQ